MLIIYYDGQCPLCSKEMSHLKQYDKESAIDLVDIHQKNFQSLHPDISFNKAMKILHGKYKGKQLLGLEVTHRAWTLVGKGFWVAPLNWPIIKQLSHGVYLGLAKYRHSISSFLAKRFGLTIPHCSSGACYDKSKNTDRRSK
jgi:predicted DCC family thiol-disulfide oxidoreductase YuxK